MPTIGRCLAALMSLPTVTALVAAAPGAAGAGSPTSCPQYETALRTYAPAGGWDVTQMSEIMARESNCDPTAHSARDSGLLQINDVNLAWLTTQLGTVVDRTTLTDPAQNIRAAAVLCTFWTGRGKSCDYPWRPDLYRPPGTPSTTTPPTTIATMMGATTPAVPSSAAPTAASTARSAAAPASGTALVQAGAYSTPAAAAQAVAALAAKGFGGFVVSGNGPYRVRRSGLSSSAATKLVQALAAAGSAAYVRR
jgi:hypothetical protein